MLLQHNYAQHPGFRFEQAPLDVDSRSMEAFNEAYSEVEIYRERLARKEYRYCTSRCVDSLRAVFGTLRAQTGDAHEALFLEELSREGERLLHDELRYLYLGGHEGGVTFTDQKTRERAMALSSVRHYFGQLPADTVREITAVGADDLARFRQAATEGRTRREDLSSNSGAEVREIVAILNRDFHRQGVLDTLTSYMRRRMFVTGLALELSVPQAKWWASSYQSLPRPPRTLYAHLDESFAYPKAIVYLSKVEADNGPTSCYPGIYEGLTLHPLQAIVGRVLASVGSSESSPLHEYYAKQYHQSLSSERFRRHFMRLPPQLRFNSHFGWDVLPDSDIERSLVERERAMQGEAGTYVVFDGARLLHRGGLLERGERIVLQVVFSHVTLARRMGRRVKRFLR